MPIWRKIMANYFTPVDFDTIFPVTPEVAPAPGLDPAVVQAKAEAVHAVIKQITNELTKIRSGQSALVPTATQFVENKTPFCIALNHLPEDRSKMTPVMGLALTALARQDFGERFATFVLELFKPVFKDVK